MAQWNSGINEIVTTPSGDTVKQGFDKVNANFGTVYNKLNGLRRVRRQEGAPIDADVGDIYYDDANKAFMEVTNIGISQLPIANHDNEVWTLGVTLMNARQNDMSALNVFPRDCKLVGYTILCQPAPISSTNLAIYHDELKIATVTISGTQTLWQTPNELLIQANSTFWVKVEGASGILDRRVSVIARVKNR